VLLFDQEGVLLARKPFCSRGSLTRFSAFSKAFLVRLRFEFQDLLGNLASPPKPPFLRWARGRLLFFSDSKPPTDLRPPSLLRARSESSEDRSYPDSALCFRRPVPSSRSPEERLSPPIPLVQFSVSSDCVLPLNLPVP